jgi:signal transduction histidine kinase
LLLSKEVKNPLGEATAWRGLSSYYLHTKNYEKAIACIDSSLAVCNRNNFLHDKSKALSVKSSVLYAMQRLKEGDEALIESDEIQDKLIGDETQNRIVIAEKRFETEKKESQIQLQQAQLKQKNTLNYVFAGSAIAFLIISGLIYRNYRHRQKLQQAKIDELETEKQLTATTAVLKGEEQERTRLAKDLHDGLGGMLSGIKYSLNNMKENLIMTPGNARAFERSIDMLDSSINEMRRVAHNMMPEVLLKYGLNTALKEFCNEIDRSGVLQVNYQCIDAENVAATVEQTVSVTVYRIVQELVNNAIKHAQAQNVLVQLHVHENNLSVTVEDDGKGFDTTLIRQSAGIGWRNIQSRIDFLKGTMDVKSDKNNGTSVLIEMNI